MATVVPHEVVRSLARFVIAHGGFATAVLEPLGRPGVRIVVLGDDGAWGDQIVRDMPTALAACQAAKVDVADGWNRELSSLLSSKATK